MFPLVLQQVGVIATHIITLVAFVHLLVQVNGVNVVGELCLGMGREGAELTNEPLVILPPVVVQCQAGLAVLMDNLKQGC